MAEDGPEGTLTLLPILRREACTGLAVAVGPAAVRIAEGGLVVVVFAPLTTEGVGEEPFLTSVVGTVALFVAMLVRNGALVVVVEMDDCRPATGRAAGLSEAADTTPAGTPVVVLRAGAVDVLVVNVEARGGEVFEGDAAVVEALGGFRPAAVAVVGFGAVVVPATDGRALPGTFLSVVEVAVVLKGGRVVVDALPASVVRAFASAVTVALGLRGAAAAAGLGETSVDGEGTAGSTGDSSPTGPPTSAGTALSLSESSSFSSSTESPSLCPFAGRPYSPCPASWVAPGICAGVGSRTASVIVSCGPSQKLTVFMGQLQGI